MSIIYDVTTQFQLVNKIKEIVELLSRKYSLEFVKDNHDLTITNTDGVFTISETKTPESYASFHTLLSKTMTFDEVWERFNMYDIFITVTSDKESVEQLKKDTDFKVISSTESLNIIKTLGQFFN